MQPDQSLSTRQEIEASPPSRGIGWRVLIFIPFLFLAFVLGSWVTRQSRPLPHSQALVTSTASFEMPVIVQISGQIKNPGVYELPFNSRIYQAIAKAGGVLPDADLSAVNLAAWVEDGSQINIPAIESTSLNVAPTPSNDLPSLSEIPSLGLESYPTRSTFPKVEKPAVSKPATSQSRKSTFKETPKSPVDLNRATAEELQKLPGIGPAMAGRILAYRKEIGGFTSVNELDNVRGIGAKTLEKIAPFLIVKPLPSQMTR